MIEPFTESARAIAYLCQEMRQHHPDGKALITQYAKRNARPRTHVTECSHMVPVLERFCERFCEALVVHGLHFDHYAVGAIQCRCYAKLRRACPLQCQDHYERPIVTIVTFKEELDTTDEGRQRILDLIEAEVHKQVHHPDDHIGRHGSGASTHRK